MRSAWMFRCEFCEVPYCAVNDNPAVFWCRVLENLLDFDLLLWHGACIAEDWCGEEVGKLIAKEISLATCVDHLLVGM